MADTRYILGIDQGTTSTRAVLFDDGGIPVHIAQRELPQIFPDDGWVEHDPEEIWSATVAVCVDTIAACPDSSCDCLPPKRALRRSLRYATNAPVAALPWGSSG